MNHPPSISSVMPGLAAGGPQPGDLLGSAESARWPNRPTPCCAAAGEAYGCVPVPHSCLVDTPSVAYLPKTCTVGRQPEPCAVTRSSSRGRRRNAYVHSVLNQSRIAIRVGRPVPVSRARPEVAAHQRSSGVEGRTSIPGSGVPLPSRSIDEAQPRSVTGAELVPIGGGKVVPLWLEESWVGANGAGWKSRFRAWANRLEIQTGRTIGKPVRHGSGTLARLCVI
jgi:hypothetical protein